MAATPLTRILPCGVLYRMVNERIREGQHQEFAWSVPRRPSRLHSGKGVQERCKILKNEGASGDMYENKGQYLVEGREQVGRSKVNSPLRLRSAKHSIIDISPEVGENK
jgi:hypothetical protein